MTNLYLSFFLNDLVVVFVLYSLPLMCCLVNLHDLILNIFVLPSFSVVTLIFLNLLLHTSLLKPN